MPQEPVKIKLNQKQLSQIREQALKNIDIASKSFANLIIDENDFLPENHDNIENVELTIDVINLKDQDKNEKKGYLLTYKKQQNTQQYILVSIYDIDDEKRINKIEGKNISDFTKFDYIIGIYVDKYTVDYYEKNSTNGNLYKINRVHKKINMKQEPEQQQQQQQQQQQEQQEPEKQEQEPTQGGKLKAKGQKKKPSKKPVVSQSKENKYKEVLGKRMKIYKKPDSRKEFVRYKGELVALVEYKKSKKEMAKSKK